MKLFVLTFCGPVIESVIRFGGKRKELANVQILEDRRPIFGVHRGVGL